MFVVIGIAVATYVAYAVLTGTVVAERGIAARRVLREERPVYFWTCVTIYGLLAVALITVF